MFIQNAVLKAISTDGLEFPLLEGTVITGDTAGIVMQTIQEAPPTAKIYVATGGTIDLADPANANVSFTEAQINALGGDFNFIPAAEAGGGSSLPAYTSSDIGKVLTVGEATETVVVVPEQTVTTNESGEAALIGVDFSKLTDGQSVTVTAIAEGGGTYQIVAEYVDGTGLAARGATIVSETSFFGPPSETVSVSASASLARYITIPFIPEQTVTLDENDEAPLTGGAVLPSDVGTGDTAMLTVTADGETHTITLPWNAERGEFENDGNTVALYSGGYDGESWVVYVYGGDGTYTLSAVLQKPVPEVTWSFNQGGVEGTYYIDSNGTFDVSTYAEAEVSVPASAVVSGTKTISRNGTFDVTNYASATVNVSPTGTMTITQNGTYNVANYAAADVNVPDPALAKWTIANNSTLDCRILYAVSILGGKIVYSSAGIYAPKNEETEFYVPYTDASRATGCFIEVQVINSDQTVPIPQMSFTATSGGINTAVISESSSNRNYVVNVFNENSTRKITVVESGT